MVAMLYRRHSGEGREMIAAGFSEPDMGTQEDDAAPLHMPEVR
jgi:hypothetical protein